MNGKLSEVNIGDMLKNKAKSANDLLRTKAKGIGVKTRDALIHGVGHGFGLETPAANNRLKVRALTDKLHNLWRGYLSGARYGGNQIEGNMQDLEHFIINYLGLGDAWNAPFVKQVVEKVANVDQKSQQNSDDKTGTDQNTNTQDTSVQPTSNTNAQRQPALRQTYVQPNDTAWENWWNKLSPEWHQWFDQAANVQAANTGWELLSGPVKQAIIRVAEEPEVAARLHNESRKTKGSLLEARMARSQVEMVFKAIASYELHQGRATTNYAMSRAEKQAAKNQQNGSTNKKTGGFNPESIFRSDITPGNLTNAFKQYRNTMEEEDTKSYNLVNNQFEKAKIHSMELWTLLTKRLIDHPLHSKVYIILLSAINKEAEINKQISIEGFNDAVSTSTVSGHVLASETDLIRNFIQRGYTTMNDLFKRVSPLSPAMFITLIYAIQHSESTQVQQ